MEDLVQKITQLLTETGHAHHQAYMETDGADAEWPMWYAEYLKDKLATILDAQFTKSELVYLLILMDRTQRIEAPGANWRQYYARFLINRYL